MTVPGTTVTTLATLTLPAGSYLLVGKVALLRTAGTGASLCTLNDGATVLDQLGNQASTAGELTVLQTSIVLSATTSLTLRCANSSAATTTAASFRVFSAYKLNSLTVQ